MLTFEYEVIAVESRGGDTVFQRLGGTEGVRALANCFYDVMEERADAKPIRDMHPKDLSDTRENLTLFLCGWLGGPRLYFEKHGAANLGGIHAFLTIDIAERDMWLCCMETAISRQPLDKDLQYHLLERFRVPAEKIRIGCQQQVKGLPVLAPTFGE